MERKLTSPTVLRDLLARHGIRLRSELGQHFLVDENTLARIVDLVEAQGDETAVEVGAGAGTLTCALAPRVRELGDLLGRVIEEYEKHHPAVTGSEVRQALQLAAGRSKASGAVAARVAALGAAVALALGGVVAFVALRGGGGVDPQAVPMVAVAVGIFSILTVAILLKRLSGR